MRHGVDGRQFGRNTSHRVAMLKNLANNLIKHDQIVTTIEKAKETRRVTERLITLAKRDTLNARRLAFARTRDDEVVTKLFGELIQRHKGRAGGYTRIVKVSETRWGDAAKMAMIELVDHPKLDRKKKVKAAKETSEGDSLEQAPSDPFSKFRKLFAGGKKKEVGDQKAKAEKAAAASGEAKPAKAASEKAPKAAKTENAEKAPAKKAAAKKTDK